MAADGTFWTRARDALEAAFAEAETRLCGLDGAIGDGDHGTSMLLGLREARARLPQGASARDLLDCLGESYLETVGGVTGVVFGSWFAGMGAAAGLEPQLDAAGLHRVLAAGLAAVRQRGRVSEGDKSMVDALAPAVEAVRRAAEAGRSAAEALAAAAAAAEQGRDATMDMEARVGRARTQPGKGRGHVDAGAASVALVFQTLSAVAEDRAEPLR